MLVTCFWWATAALAFYPRVRLWQKSCAPQGYGCRQGLLNIHANRHHLTHRWTDRRILRRSKQPGYRSALLKQPISCSTQSSFPSTISQLNKVTFDARVPPKTVQGSAQRSLWLHYSWVRKPFSSGSLDLRIPVVISSGFETDGQLLPHHVSSH